MVLDKEGDIETSAFIKICGIFKGKKAIITKYKSHLDTINNSENTNSKFICVTVAIADKIGKYVTQVNLKTRILTNKIYSNIRVSSVLSGQTFLLKIAALKAKQVTFSKTLKSYFLF